MCSHLSAICHVGRFGEFILVIVIPPITSSPYDGTVLVLRWIWGCVSTTVSAHHPLTQLLKRTIVLHIA